MPDNKNQNQNQNQGRKNQGVDQGTIDQDLEKDTGMGRQQQGNKGQVGGGQKDSSNIEKEDQQRRVGNDNDLDRDLENADEDREEGEITQRNPRVGEQGQQGQGQMDRDEGFDRDRNR